MPVAFSHAACRETFFICLCRWYLATPRAGYSSDWTMFHVKFASRGGVAIDAHFPCQTLHRKAVLSSRGGSLPHAHINFVECCHSCVHARCLCLAGGIRCHCRECTLAPFLCCLRAICRECTLAVSVWPVVFATVWPRVHAHPLRCRWFLPLRVPRVYAVPAAASTHGFFQPWCEIPLTTHRVKWMCLLLCFLVSSTTKYLLFPHVISI